MFKKFFDCIIDAINTPKNNRSFSQFMIRLGVIAIEQISVAFTLAATIRNDSVRIFTGIGNAILGLIAIFN